MQRQSLGSKEKNLSPSPGFDWWSVQTSEFSNIGALPFLNFQIYSYAPMFELRCLN